MAISYGRAGPHPQGYGSLPRQPPARIRCIKQETPLSLAMIRKLNQGLGIAAEVLIQETGM